MKRINVIRFGVVGEGNAWSILDTSRGSPEHPYFVGDIYISRYYAQLQADKLNRIINQFKYRQDGRKIHESIDYLDPENE